MTLVFILAAVMTVSASGGAGAKHWREIHTNIQVLE